MLDSLNLFFYLSQNCRRRSTNNNLSSKSEREAFAATLETLFLVGVRTPRGPQRGATPANSTHGPNA